MSNQPPPTDTSKNSDQARADDNFVAAYLATNPDFFKYHPEVLEKVYLPHNSGSAVSLVEKQQSVLRERNSALQTKLGNLLDSSKTNDDLFGKTRNLILSLIKANNLGQIFSALDHGLNHEFGIPFSNFILLDQDASENSQKNGALSATSEQVHTLFPTLLTSPEAICGMLRGSQMTLLFGDQGSNVGSAVAIALCQGSTSTHRNSQHKPFAILALGNADSHHYHSQMDSLFLHFIADVLNTVVYPRL